MYSGEGNQRQLKVCDFGLSAVVTPGGGCVGYAGTPSYMATEAIAHQRGGQGAPPYDGRVDVFAMGLCAYELGFQDDKGHFAAAGDGKLSKCLAPKMATRIAAVRAAHDDEAAEFLALLEEVVSAAASPRETRPRAEDWDAQVSSFLVGCDEATKKQELVRGAACT